MSTDRFYIVDVRQEWRGNPYLTLWRPDNAGYAYPTAWAGQYTREQIEGQGTYYWRPRYGAKLAMDRFPVPCWFVDGIGIQPRDGIVDGNTGLVIPNTKFARDALRRHAFRPASVTPDIERQIRQPDQPARAA